MSESVITGTPIIQKCCKYIDGTNFWPEDSVYRNRGSSCPWFNIGVNWISRYCREAGFNDCDPYCEGVDDDYFDRPPQEWPSDPVLLPQAFKHPAHSFDAADCELECGPCPFNGLCSIAFYVQLASGCNFVCTRQEYTVTIRASFATRAYPCSDGSSCFPEPTITYQDLQLTIPLISSISSADSPVIISWSDVVELVPELTERVEYSGFEIISIE